MRGKKTAKISCEIIDAETRRPIPARVSIFDKDMNCFAPADAFHYGFNPPPGWPSDWGVKGDQKYFYADGSFAASVPRGIIWLHVFHGLEFEPFKQRIAADGDIKITAALRRITNMADEGWYCGDTHVHLAHNPVIYKLSPEDVCSRLRRKL